MPDLDQRFRSLDALAPPDMRREIARRAEGPAPPEPSRSPGSRILAVLVAFIVFASAVALGVRALRPEPVDEPPTPPALWPGVGVGFTRLPDPPISGQGMVELWGGDHLFLWGGQVGDDQPHRDEGYLFDPMSLTWKQVAPSPLSARSFTASAWTGEEFLVWGGVEGEAYPYDRLRDGAAYDPIADSWRPIADAPMPSDPYPSGIWTGTEFIVLYNDWARDEAPGVAYDPARDAWRILPPPTVALQDVEAAWTGRDVAVIGAPPSGNWPHVSAGVAAYEPGTDRWHWLGETGLVPYSTAIAWDGSQLVAMDYNNRVVAFDEASDGWSALPQIPANQCEGGLTTPALHQGALLVSACADFVALEPDAERWRVLAGEGESSPPIEFAGPLAAGDVVLLRPWVDRYEQAMWAYRMPPATDARRAWDVAAAFAAIRAGYPYTADQVPQEALDALAPLVSDVALGRYEDPGVVLPPLWTYYYGFRVISVQGTQAPFEVVIRLERGGAVDERLTIGPGTGSDGVLRDLVILDVELVLPDVLRQDGQRIGVVGYAEEPWIFQSDELAPGDIVRCDQTTVAVPPRGETTSVDRGWLVVETSADGSVSAWCQGP